MITHFAGLKLKTVSIQGVKQFYHGLLHFPVASESEVEIVFQPTPDFTLAFEEAYEPIAPAHIAFEVPYSQFESMLQKLAEQVPLLKWPDGEAVERFDTGVNVYFKDGDGNLLEFIAHEDLKEGACAERHLWHPVLAGGGSACGGSGSRKIMDEENARVNDRQGVGAIRFCHWRNGSCRCCINKAQMDSDRHECAGTILGDHLRSNGRTVSGPGSLHSGSADDGFG